MALVTINQSTLIETPLEESFLTADIASGSSTITVANITGFAINQVLVINPFGERAEIILTHASTAPSGTTITLKATTTTGQTHYAGEKVYLISYDQVEISNAATATGSKSVLTTANLQPDKTEFVYNDTAGSTGYYFARFKNSITSVFSSYTDPLLVAGWERNTVGFMINQALRDLDLDFSEKVTVSDCYSWLTSGMKEIQGKLKRWPEHYSFNAILGQVQRGTNIVAMPTDAYDTETNKSLIAVRIGVDQKLTYLDPMAFDQELVDVASTQVTTQATSGQTTLAINNSYDFADSGTVDVYISNVKYSITYTGVTRSSSAGVLTGVPASGTGSISVTIPVNTYVWQGETEGTPTWFTVRNGNIEFWPLADGSHDNTNMRGDYSHVATSVDSDGDTIDYQRYDMLQDYLTWRIKMKSSNNGELDRNDGWFIGYKEKLNDAIRTLPQNIVFPMKPTVNNMSKRPSSNRQSLQNLNINDQ